MADRYKATPLKALEKARRIVAITPSDTIDLDDVSRLYVSTAGTLKITAADDTDGTSVTITVPVGELPILVKRVWTGGTAVAFVIR